jgi:hypothetical protein
MLLVFSLLRISSSGRAYSTANGRWAFSPLFSVLHTRLGQGLESKPLAGLDWAIQESRLGFNRVGIDMDRTAARQREASSAGMSFSFSSMVSPRTLGPSGYCTITSCTQTPFLPFLLRLYHVYDTSFSSINDIIRVTGIRGFYRALVVDKTSVLVFLAHCLASLWKCSRRLVV